MRLMMKLRIFFIFSVYMLLGIMSSAHAGVDSDYPTMQMLLETERTIADETIKYPQAGQAKITASIITIPPGKSTGWHQHNIPLVGYIMSGELEMKYANGKRLTLKKGDALAEAMSVAHIGANLGKEPVQIFVVFMGTDTLSSTLSVEAPSTPPHKPDANGKVDLVNLADFDRRLQIDLRYASANNFMSKPLYPVARALLQRPAAEALKRAHERLRAVGYGLVILDAYRPWQVTREMWDKHPWHRAYLADPLNGSRHNRGCAVDVTLFDLKTGLQVDMPSDYDDFSERAHPDYIGGNTAQRQARDALRSAMEAEGFSVYQNEWWHFDYQGWQGYPVLNLPLQ
jgi:D-alanyl-D-alanine dipeptidase